MIHAVWNVSQHTTPVSVPGLKDNAMNYVPLIVKCHVSLFTVQVCLLLIQCIMLVCNRSFAMLNKLSGGTIVVENGWMNTYVSDHVPICNNIFNSVESILWLY